MNNEEEYGDDEEFESETPEASNEHQDADIDINDMDQRMLNVNKMRNVNRLITDKNNFSKENDEENEIAAFYRSKSQNMSKPIEKDPKSHISSPVDGSNSTVRGPTSIPTTLQADIEIKNMSRQNNDGRVWYSSIKKWKKTEVSCEEF